MRRYFVALFSFHSFFLSVFFFFFRKMFRLLFQQYFTCSMRCCCIQCFSSSSLFGIYYIIHFINGLALVMRHHFQCNSIKRISTNINLMQSDVRNPCANEKHQKQRFDHINFNVTTIQIGNNE